MINNNLNIMIVEPSFIVYEGLVNILSKSLKCLHFTKANNLNDIHQNNLVKNIDIVFINPGLIQNQVKLLQNIKKDFSTVKWVGIVYILYDQKLLNLFDSLIYLDDTPDKIANSIQKLLNSSVHSEQNQQETLSAREIEVLKLLVAGNAIKEIADKLFLSTHTVISHRKNISQKTGIKSVSGLTIYAVVNNLITLESFE
ncbi:MAG: LuxR C-terminal-related transcriptional regulator [bacterium]